LAKSKQKKRKIEGIRRIKLAAAFAGRQVRPATVAPALTAQDALVYAVGRHSSARNPERDLQRNCDTTVPFTGFSLTIASYFKIAFER
jgi:hypothetical protein